MAIRQNRWFFYFIGFLIILNLTIAITLHYVSLDDYVRKYLTKTLAKELNASVTIQKLSIAENRLSVHGIRIKDNKNEYDLQIHSVYVNYNLLKLLFSSVKKSQFAKDIIVYDPNLILNIRSSEKKQKKGKKFEISQITSIIKKIRIYNATVSIGYKSPSLSINKRFSNLNIVLDSENNTDIKFYQNKTEKFSGEAKFNKNKLTFATISIRDFNVNDININKLPLVIKNFEGNFVYNSGKYNLNVNFPGISGEYDLFYENQKHKLDFAVKDLSLNSSDSKTTVSSNDLALNGALGSVFAEINNSGDKIINSKIQFSGLNPADFYADLTGSVNTDIEVGGTLKEPVVSFSLKSPVISYKEQSFTEINVNGVVTEQLISLNPSTAYWRNNLVNLSGEYDLKTNNFALSAVNDTLVINEAGVLFSGSLKTSVSNNTGLQVKSVLQNCSLKYDAYTLKDLSGELTYLNDSADLLLQNPDKSFSTHITGQVNTNDFSGVLAFNNMRVDTITNSDIGINRLTGQINAKFFEKLLTSSLDLHFNENNNKLGFKGDLKSDLTFNTVDNDLSLTFKTQDMKRQNIPLKIMAAFKGKPDSLSSEYFLINNDITISALLSLSKPLESKIEITGRKLDVPHYLSYYFAENSINDVAGTVAFNFKYDPADSTSIIGDLVLNGLDYQNIKNIRLSLLFDGDLNKIDFTNCSIFMNNKSLADLKGFVKMKPEFAIESKGNFADLALSNFDLGEDLKGYLSGAFDLQYSPSNANFSLDVKGDSIFVGTIAVDTLLIDLKQKESQLFVDKFLLSADNTMNLNAFGCLDYNFLNNKPTNGYNKLFVNFNGDPLKLMNDYYQAFDVASSKFWGNLELSYNDDGLNFEKGSITLDNGKLQIPGQQEIIDKIRFNLDINNNEAKFSNFSARMGKGRLYVRNESTDIYDNFLVGNLNFGQFKLRTDEQGVLVHIPEYTPENTVVNAVLKGRGTPEATIRGPLNDIKIVADAYANNGYGVYPPDTENLLTLFTKLKTEYEDNYTESHSETEDEEEMPLPFNLDLNIIIANNVKYVTYPTNFLVNPNSYLHLMYNRNEDDWTVPDANFISEEGSMEIFGTIFQVEYISVLITPFDDYPLINGTFIKKSSDGSTITLTVSPKLQKVDNFFQNLNFELTSDNPDDKTKSEILAKLRYNRTLDELSKMQQETLLQDEAVNLVGIGLGNAFLDPLITPFESIIRRKLKLDSFSISPGFIQNLYEGYKSNEFGSNMSGDVNSIINFGSSLVLNNLSVEVGKYLSRNVFLNYNAYLQESTNLGKNTKFYLDNSISLRYDLPKQFKIYYKYELNQINQKNSHELMLLKSLKF